MKDSFAEKYNVTKHIKHPKYNKLSKKNDIALLRLDRSISFESRKDIGITLVNSYSWYFAELLKNVRECMSGAVFEKLVGI